MLAAHPTEAKRVTILEHYRELYLLMLALLRIWKTGEIYLDKPDSISELRHIIHYLTNVFPEVMPIIDRRLLQAVEFNGMDHHRISEEFLFPQISLGDWVGGDREGHPLVDAKMTKENLLQLKLNAFVVIKRKLNVLLQKLSFRRELGEFSANAQRRVREMVQELGEEKGQAILDRNDMEAFRQFVGPMLTKLPVELQRRHATKLWDSTGSNLTRLSGRSSPISTPASLRPTKTSCPPMPSWSLCKLMQRVYLFSSINFPTVRSTTLGMSFPITLVATR